jgi:hypothetical protein
MQKLKATQKDVGPNLRAHPFANESDNPLRTGILCNFFPLKTAGIRGRRNEGIKNNDKEANTFAQKLRNKTDEDAF